jgi:Ca-activated chloride channel family protein
MWNNIELEYPWMLALGALPIIWYLVWPAYRWRAAALLYPDFNNANTYLKQPKRKRALPKKQGVLPWTFKYLLWLLLVVALAQPVEVGKPQLEVKTSRSFLLVCDISFSMAQKDWEFGGEKVRRWDAVKEVMHQFITDREGDRMGLVFFGSSAYIQSPFTTDLQVVDTLLEQADVGMAGQMTNIGKAIVKGLTMFEEDTLNSKVMLLLTDGVDSGTDILPLDAASLALHDSVIVYTLGIGNALGGPTDLDETTLKEIANLTTGKYFKAESIADLDSVYAEIDKLEPITYQEEKYVPKTALFYYPLGAAIAACVVFVVFHVIGRIIIKQQTI